MKNLLLGGLALLSTSVCAQPHLTLGDSTNLILNPTANGMAGWVVPSPELYDPAVSHSPDGSGAFRLSKAYFDNPASYDRVYTGVRPVTAGKQYTLSVFMRSEVFPGPMPTLYVTFRDADRRFIKNDFGSMQANTAADIWEEAVYAFRPPAGTAYVSVMIMLGKQSEDNPGSVWVDDIHMSEGMGFRQAPAPKQPFEGEHTRIDPLGNIEVNRDGTWQPFIPLCIYASNHRPDWRFYSEQGFNCNMWAGSHLYVDKAKQAVSDFNPHGMMSGFQIANFIIPGHKDYRDYTLLDTRIEQIVNAGLSDSLLFYYWDNENEQIDEWQVPLAVTQRIRAHNTGHPIYMLMGNEGLTRKYKNANVDMIDLTGDYMNISRERDHTGMTIADNVENQRAPLSIAQLNFGTGLRFKARIYAALAKGAKGFGVWRDDYLQAGTQAGPIETTPWWEELPQIRRELDQITDLIRQPHWTQWQASVDSDAIDVGTRDHDGHGVIILANETAEDVATSITLTDLPYAGAVVVDEFEELPVMQIVNGEFNVTVPAYGRRVLNLLQLVEEVPMCCDLPGVPKE